MFNIIEMLQITNGSFIYRINRQYWCFLNCVCTVCFSGLLHLISNVVPTTENKQSFYVCFLLYVSLLFLKTNISQNLLSKFKLDYLILEIVYTTFLVHPPFTLLLLALITDADTDTECRHAHQHLPLSVSLTALLHFSLLHRLAKFFFCHSDIKLVFVSDADQLLTGSPHSLLLQSHTSAIQA